MRKTAVQMAELHGKNLSCPNCTAIQYLYSEEGPGVYKCSTCYETFELTQGTLSDWHKANQEEDPEDLKTQIKYLERRIEKLEKELGIK